MPARIARGELDGKMKCRIWRKLHAEEAKRFDQAYALLEKHPQLSLADAFGMLQSGLSFEDFQARREKVQRKTEVKQARSSVDNSVVAGWFNAQQTSEEPLCLVLADRTLIDVLLSEESTFLQLQKTGRLEKLQVVAVSRRATWEPLLPLLNRDARLAQRPTPVARQPDKRPFSDPRAFLSQVGQTLRLQLRNGLELVAPLLATGGYDLVLGDEGEEILVPLHALLHWELAPDSTGDASPGDESDDT